MKTVVLLLLLAVARSRSASVSEARIWFEGEKMPNSNEDVPRERDVQATGTNGVGQKAGDQQGYDGRTTTVNPLPDRLGGVRPSFSVVNRDTGSGQSPPSRQNSGSSNSVPGFTVTNESGSGSNRPSGNSGSSSNNGQSYSSRLPSNSGLGTNQGYPSRQGSGDSGSGQVYPSRHGLSPTSQQTSTTFRPAMPNRQQTGFSLPAVQDLSYRPKPSVNNRRNQTSYLAGGDTRQTMVWGMPLERVLSRGVGRLALDLERVTNRPGNRLFSPISIGTALALILLGASGNTRQELYHFLGVDSTIEPSTRSELHMELGNIFKKMESSQAAEVGPQFAFASGVFVQDGFQVSNKYALLAQLVYKAQVLNLDFQNQPTTATSSINRWVSNKTFGRIQNILSEPLNRETKVVIANVLYFNGEWEHPFPAHDTKRKPFYVTSSEAVDVDMMVNAADVYYAENKKRSYRILGLPYKGGDVVMFIVLPEPENADPRTFVRSLSPSDLEEMANETNIQTVIYTVPKMRLEGSMHLRRPLERLGVRTLFDPARADLTNLAQGVALTNIFHKVEIEVTETGTTASATTIATLTRDGTTPVFRVDRPFLFFIRHSPTNIITFWGTVFRATPYFPHMGN